MSEFVQGLNSFLTEGGPAMVRILLVAVLANILALATAISFVISDRGRLLLILGILTLCAGLLMMGIGAYEWHARSVHFHAAAASLPDPTELEELGFNLELKYLHITRNVLGVALTLGWPAIVLGGLGSLSGGMRQRSRGQSAA